MFRCVILSLILYVIEGFVCVKTLYALNKTTDSIKKLEDFDFL